MERALAGVRSPAASSRIASVGDRVKAYLAHYPLNHRERSCLITRQRLSHVSRLLGSCLLCDLDEDTIRDYIHKRIEDGAGGRTINMEVGKLSRALELKWSTAWPHVRKVEENHDVGRALSPEEEARLLRAAAYDGSPNRNPMLYCFLRIALSTGMRSGEIVGLRWSQIDLESEIITVGRKAKTKAGSGRQIPMNPDLKTALEMHAAWYADPKHFGEIRPDWFVFPGRKGRPTKDEPRPLDPTIPSKSINTSWERLRERAGVRCRLHDLRHTAATKLAEAGVSESTMKAIMGHMSVAMLERYSHIRMAAKREAVKAMRLQEVTAADDTGESSTLNGVPKESPKVDRPNMVQ